MEHIKERKTVMLDEVAAEFGLRTQDVINRIQSLESIGRLTGVMDDRGKVRSVSVSVRASAQEQRLVSGRADPRRTRACCRLHASQAGSTGTSSDGFWPLKNSLTMPTGKMDAAALSCRMAPPLSP